MGGGRGGRMLQWRRGVVPLLSSSVIHRPTPHLPLAHPLPPAARCRSTPWRSTSKSSGWWPGPPIQEGGEGGVDDSFPPLVLVVTVNPFISSHRKPVVPFPTTSPSFGPPRRHIGFQKYRHNALPSGWMSQLYHHSPPLGFPQNKTSHSTM